MKKIIFLVLLSFTSKKIIAQNIDVETISYTNTGGKRLFSKFYYFTKDSIIKHKKYSDSRKGIEKISKVNFVGDWNNLLNKINIKYFRKIKNGKSRAAHCGSDIDITLTLKSGEKITIRNASNDKMWSDIEKKIHLLKI